MQYLLITSPWPGVILWIFLYISDYYLTIYSARGFREIDRFELEGSFELTPFFQKDIDALKPVSKRHVVLLILYSLIIIFLWWFTFYQLEISWAYLLYLGMFLLLETAVHVRHLRNVFLIREVRKNGGMEGHLKYQRWFTYKISAVDMYLFSALFFIVTILTFSPFFLGGALMCFGTGIKHTLLARKSKPLPTAETTL